ncbi:MAG: MoaD/ThiS family protein [Candidatus Aenigmarchaeota archaeon]|nr:MoaD/ThiS family protein [Candidatus Aenigmarchaeota archaeon]
MEKAECPECGKNFDTSDAMKQHRNDKHAKQEATVVVRKPKLTFGKVLTYGIILLVVVGIGYALIWALTAPSTGIGAPGSTHIHQDFKVYVSGNAIDFSLGKYQKPHLNAHVHLEGGDGDLIHVHATGVTMEFFLKSLGIKFEKDCLTMDTGDKYCNEGDKALKFYVNSKPSSEWEKYVLKDGDKILVSYGNESEDQITQQLSSVTDKAKRT